MYNVPEYKAVTLNDVKVHFAEKIFVITENPISLFHKTPDCSGGAGTGSIDRNDEFLHAVYFLVFQMFNECAYCHNVPDHRDKEYSQNFLYLYEVPRGERPKCLR